MDISTINTKAANMLGGLPVTLVIGTKTISGASGVAFFRLRYSEWGAQHNYERTIYVRRVDFANSALPDALTKCTVDGREKRILQVEPDAGNIIIGLAIGGLRNRG